MKKFKYLYLLFLTCSTTLLFSKEKFVIGARGKNVGFFSNFFGVINNLIWCEKNNKNPVVFWDKTNLYYDFCRGENVWEYYFNPISSLSYEQGDKIRVSYLAPDGSGVKAKGYLLFSKITNDYRQYMHKVIKKYITLKPEVSKKIEKYYNQHLRGKKTIGIHVRGFRDGVRPLDIKKIIKTANTCECDQFFIATDEEKNIEILKNGLNKKIIYYPAHRSLDSNFLYLQPSSKLNVSKAELGEEVLIEATLLSLCNLFIHSASNVALAVLFLNPELKNIYLSPVDQ